jgi:tetratricopeptide (TPR) repeat protein
VGFFLVVFLALQILRVLPVVGPIFQIPFLGFWGAAILISLAASRWATLALDRRGLSRRIRDLGFVDTPHNQGKLGSLLVGGRRYGAAIPPLEKAVEGEPDVAEWRYRLGLAHLGCRRPREAAEALAAAAALDEEHAYGAVLMRLAEARLKVGDIQGAIEALDRRDRNHGPDPESAYRRGRALKALGRPDEARASFAEVSKLARRAAGFQRAEARKWAALAVLARVV